MCKLVASVHRRVSARVRVSVEFVLSTGVWFCFSQKILSTMCEGVKGWVYTVIKGLKLTKDYGSNSKKIVVSKTVNFKND